MIPELSQPGPWCKLEDSTSLFLKSLSPAQRTRGQNSTSGSFEMESRSISRGGGGTRRPCQPKPSPQTKDRARAAYARHGRGLPVDLCSNCRASEGDRAGSDLERGRRGGCPRGPLYIDADRADRGGDRVLVAQKHARLPKTRIKTRPTILYRRRPTQILSIGI